MDSVTQGRLVWPADPFAPRYKFYRTAEDVSAGWSRVLQHNLGWQVAVGALALGTSAVRFRGGSPDGRFRTGRFQT